MYIVSFFSTEALISNVKTEKRVHAIGMPSKFLLNLCLQTNRAGSGIMNLGGSLTRQVYVRCKLNNPFKISILSNKIEIGFIVLLEEPLP